MAYKMSGIELSFDGGRLGAVAELLHDTRSPWPPHFIF